MTWQDICHKIHLTLYHYYVVEDAEIKNMEDLCGILSKYVIEGNVRGSAWSEGVRNGVFGAALSKMKEILEFWGKEPRSRG